MPHRRREVIQPSDEGNVSLYVPDPAERELAACLQEFGQALPQSGILRAVLEKLCLISPTRAVDALETRIRAHPRGDGVNALFRKLLDEPEPALEAQYLTEILAVASREKGERSRVETMLGLARFWQQQHSVPARFRAVLAWLRRYREEHPGARILIFAQDAAIVQELSQYLSAKLGPASVDRFESTRPQIELETVARSFQTGAIQVLVSDELGGEGRNFQCAAAIVHVDLPWSPGRVEQRVGRLDRLGRASTDDVLSVVCCGISELERTVFEMLDCVFDVFRRSIGPVEFQLSNLRTDLAEAIGQGPWALRRFFGELREHVTGAFREDDEALEAALQLSQQELDEGKQLAEAIEELDAQQWQDDVVSWSHELGITCERQWNQSFRVAINPERLRVDVSDVPGMLKSGIFGTFGRTRALEDESLHLLGPGHPFIQALEAMVDVSWFGRVAIQMKDLGPDLNGPLYALFHLVHEPDFNRLHEFSCRGLIELAVLQAFPPGTDWVGYGLPGFTPAPPSRLRQRNPVADRRVELDQVASMPKWNLAMDRVDQAGVRAMDDLRNARQGVRQGALKSYEDRISITLTALRQRMENEQDREQASAELRAWQVGAEAIRSEKIAIESIQLIFTPKSKAH